jgi:acetyl-CoA carboxylase biotin carboxyl carrier protein
VSNSLELLSDDDIRRIAALVETLDRSTFDFLSLDVGGVKLTIGKGPVPEAAPAALPAAPAARVAAPVERTAPEPEPAQPPAPSPRPAPAPVARAEEAEAITAPIIGRFYASPEPGSPPFVSVGSEVEPDTTVGVIEVMKVFTAIRAGVKGVVRQICVENEQFVEFGQVLFRIEPAAGKQAAPRKERKERVA